MYFNDKSDTNIDDELKESAGSKFGINLDFIQRYLKWIIIGVIVLILLVILIVFLKGRSKYILLLNGDAEMTIYQGDKFVDPGYSAYDKKKNDVSSEVEVDDSSLDTNKIGEYSIFYTLHNVRRTRSVSVVEKPLEATYMYLKGDMTIKLKVGEKYVEPGWTVVDTYDPDLGSKVKVESNVDTSKVGTYIITYHVANSKGVTTSATRVVEVSK